MIKSVKGKNAQDGKVDFMDTPKRKLSEKTIRDWVGETSFSRGEQYFRDGMIFNARRAGSTLKADCHGSGGNAYRVRATVEDGSITAADCSCPIGGGGHCKHVAALLFTWLNQPDDVREIEDTNTALERRSKEELIALVRQMLLRVPELETLLEVPLPTGKKSNRKVNPETYRRPVAAAFRGSDYEWGAEEGIANQVDATLEIGSGFLEQRDIANAEAVFEAVANEVLVHYGEFHDGSGALSELVSRAVGGLGHCLAAESADTTLREKILNALFEVYRFDVDFGGVGLGDNVPDLILKHASSAEKKQVAEWIRAAMKKHSDNEWSDNWHRQVYGGFLLQLEADALDDEAYLRLCRETHRLKDLVERLLKLKRVDEARAEAARANDYELLQLADISARHKQAHVAEQLVTERASKSKDTRLAEWLMKHHKAKGDAANALMWARKMFDMHPSLAQYREILKLAARLDTWESVRVGLLDQLRRQKNFDLLTQIHLDAKEIGAAIETVAHVQQGFGVVYPSLRIEVAQAAEATHPRDALRLYARAAAQIIERRDRGLYDRACEYLVRVRNLYKRLGEDAAWEQYLRKIKEETKAMRVFKEEMAKAKL
ncbi:MAG: SWIM zinc finger family protein [Chloroflexota bacterium]